MAQVSAAGRTDALITSVRGPSVYATTNNGFVLREVGVFNTTTTSVRVGLCRWTATGTQGTALTEFEWDEDTPPIITAFNTHTANATAGDTLRMYECGAAVGAGIVWTFGRNGVVVGKGTANGIGIYLPGGTAQHLDFYFDWDE